MTFPELSNCRDHRAWRHGCCLSWRARGPGPPGGDQGASARAGRGGPKLRRALPARGEVHGPEPLVYSNRIHRDDAGRFLAHLIREAESGRVHSGYFTGVDNSPAPRHEVEAWLAQQLGVETRPLPPPEETPGHKRCSNKVMRQTGFELNYPDYQAGYSEVLSRR